MLRGPRASQAEDTARVYFADNPGAMQRCMELAIKVVHWMAAKNDGRIKVAANQNVEILIELPQAVKQALQLIGREARDPQTGRRLGLAGAARKILIDHIIRRFPQIAREIEQAARQQLKTNPDAPYAKPKRRPDIVKKKIGDSTDVDLIEQTRPPSGQSR